jgi:hypothetical protein
MDYCNEVYGKDYNIEFIYSTPGNFVDALRKEDVTWPTYDKDMFPYYCSTVYNSFWSGFYSSRPNLKLQIKQASGVFNAASAAMAKKSLRRDLSDLSFA